MAIILAIGTHATLIFPATDRIQSAVAQWLSAYQSMAEENGPIDWIHTLRGRVNVINTYFLSVCPVVRQVFFFYFLKIVVA